MVKKYVDALEGRIINSRTNKTWKINDVGYIWLSDVKTQIEKDGYIILNDGTVTKEIINSEVKDGE